MDRSDLFSMIFLTMDHYWDEHKGEQLGQFLSNMNPFLFEGEGSAVPDVYTEFCSFLGDRDITVENSYQIAVEYVDSLGEQYVKDAFIWIDEDKWIKRCKKYLESDDYCMNEIE